MDEEKQALIKKYDLEILDLLNATKEKRVNIGRFRSMVIKNGGYATAKRLIPQREVSQGLQNLKMADLLHMSAEAVAIKPQYEPIFTAEELEIAKEKLSQLNYHPE